MPLHGHRLAYRETGGDGATVLLVHRVTISAATYGVPAGFASKLTNGRVTFVSLDGGERVIEQLRQGLETADSAAVIETLAEDVTLRVAVHDAPFEGRQAVGAVLGVVLDGVLAGVGVSETIEGDAGTVVLFDADVMGYAPRAQGLLVVRANEAGRVRALTVFLRPLAALQALSDEMGRRFDGPRPEGGG